MGHPVLDHILSYLINSCTYIINKLWLIFRNKQNVLYSFHFTVIMSRVGIFTIYWRSVLVFLSLLAVIVSIIHVESTSASGEPNQARHYLIHTFFEHL